MDRDDQYETSEETIDELWEEKSHDETRNVKTKSKGRSRFPSWTKKETHALIFLFQQKSLLYDTTHPKYAQPIHRNKALRDIHDKMQVHKPKVTIPQIRAKLKTLRSQYIKEKRKTKMDKKFIPTLWCYDRMRFLDEQGKYLEKEQRIDLMEHSQQFQMREQPDDCYIVENDNEIFVKSYDESDSDEIPVTIPSVNLQITPAGNDITALQEVTEPKPRSVLYQKCLSLVESLSTHMRDDKILDERKKRIPASLLGRMVETELSHFPEHVYDDAKWKIIKVLEEASKKNKQHNSSRVNT